MRRVRRYDLVVIGMGSGGMSAAEFAAGIGLRVAVIERHRVGGDCLWTGCVPSKALLASAKIAHHMRHADRWGLPEVPDLQIDTSGVWNRIHQVRDGIAAGDDNPERYRRLGVEVVEGHARVVGPHEVDVEGRRFTSRFILICTGSRPVTPPVEGLEGAGYLTSETVFELDRAPKSVVVIGGGPIGVELAQAMARLGVPVTVLQGAPAILPREEPVLSERLAALLAAEGVEINTGVRVEVVRRGEGGEKVVEGRSGGPDAGDLQAWTASEVLVAAGREPNVEGLGLAEVGVKVGPKGVEVDGRMRSSVASIYAAGDVAGRWLFTHSAGHEAVRAVRDMFFPGRGTMTGLVPWCTFTDPELARVGLTEEECRRLHGADTEVWSLDLSHCDRARADGSDQGALRVITSRGRILGAHILAPSAGEMIHELVLAVHKEMKLANLASMVHVYPTLSTAVATVAAEAAYAGAKRIAWITKVPLLGRIGG